MCIHISIVSNNGHSDDDGNMDVHKYNLPKNTNTNELLSSPKSREEGAGTLSQKCECLDSFWKPIFDGTLKEVTKNYP